jgi:hypothetical protein
MSTRAFVTGVVTAAVLAGSVGHAERSWERIDISGAIHVMPWGINSRGAIVGSQTTADGTVAGFVMFEAAVRTITCDATATLATGISENNEIVGIQVAKTGHVRGFLWSPSGCSPLEMPGARATLPFGINGRSIVGTYVDSAGSRHGFSIDRRGSHAGAWTTIDVASHETLVLGVNPQGDVVGQYVQDNVGRPFALVRGTLTTTDLPPRGMALAINASGLVGGASITSDSSDPVGFVFSHRATELVSAGDGPTVVTGINGRGDAVGFVVTETGIRGLRALKDPR